MKRGVYTAFKSDIGDPPRWNIRDESMRLVASAFDKDTAQLIAWALAYRTELWYSLCSCELPRWQQMNPHYFVCEQCGLYLTRRGEG